MRYSHMACMSAIGENFFINITRQLLKYRLVVRVAVIVWV